MTVLILREWLGGGLALAGGLFMLIGAIGLHRMPDVFTRMHGASVGDTLGVGLILLGLILIGGLSLVTVKLVCLGFFIGLTNPVATHALARAALQAGVTPLVAAGGKLEAPPSKP